MAVRHCAQIPGVYWCPSRLREHWSAAYLYPSPSGLDAKKVSRFERPYRPYKRASKLFQKHGHGPCFSYHGRSMSKTHIVGHTALWRYGSYVPTLDKTTLGPWTCGHSRLIRRTGTVGYRPSERWTSPLGVRPGNCYVAVSYAASSK